MALETHTHTQSVLTSHHGYVVISAKLKLWVLSVIIVTVIVSFLFRTKKVLEEILNTSVSTDCIRLLLLVIYISLVTSVDNLNE